MVILVLYQAREGVEFGDEAAEHAEFMHQVEDWINGADFRQDGPEGDGGVGRGCDGRREMRQRFANKFAQMQVEGAVELLAVAEDTDETDGVGAEDLGRFGGEFAAPHDEAVEAFGPGEAGNAEGLADGTGGVVRPASDAEGEAAFDEFGNAENRLRRPVIVLHESLEAEEHIRLRVAEIFGDTRLSIE